MSTEPVMQTATVTFWKAEQGWGELLLPSGVACFAHFSVILPAPGATVGYLSLEPGQSVTVTWEEADQDGYTRVAVSVQP